MSMLVENKNGKLLELMYVPGADNTWRDFFYIDKYNLKHWWYHNAKGERQILIKRINDPKDPLKKSFQQGSYASGKYWKQNLWTKLEDYKLPLYRLHELVKTDLETIHLLEGENAVDVAQTKFPELFFTTFMGGASNYENSDYSVLKGKKVIVVHDIEESNHGKKKFIALCHYLKDEYNIDAKLAELPSYNELQRLFGGLWEKNGFDMADDSPEGLDFKVCFDKAYTPAREELIPFSDIKKDKDNFAFIRNLGNKYWDKKKRKICSEKEIDNIFLRDQSIKGKASAWLHKNNIQVVDATTFYPSEEEIIYRNGSSMINGYRSPRHKSMGRVQGIEKRVEWFTKDLCGYLCSDEERETQWLIKALACAVQYPEIKRNWDILISSLYHGVGKGALFAIIEYLLGEANCVALTMPQLYNNFNGHLLKANNILVPECNSKGKEDSNTMTQLKLLSTESKFEVEFKGKEKLTHYCHYNLYLSSNEVQPFKAERNDRRNFYIRHEDPPQSEKFYDSIWEKIESKTELEYLAHYLQFEVKITREECKAFYKIRPKTIWWPLLVQNSLTGYQAELSAMFDQKLLPCFHWDHGCAEDVYTECRDFMYHDERNRTRILSEVPSKKQIQKWILSINGVPIRERQIEKNGEIKIISDAIEPKTDKNHKRRAHYYNWRNQEKWRPILKRREIKPINDHFNDPLIYARAHKEKTESHNSNPHGNEIGDYLLHMEEIADGDFPY